MAILTRTLERTGGAEQQLSRLAIGLRQRGTRVRVLCFYRHDELEADLEAAGVPVVALDKRGRWDTAGFFLRLRRELRRDPPDILQSYLVPPNILAALASLGMRGVHVVWGVRASAMDLQHYDWTHAALSRLERLLSRLPAAIVANSQVGRDHVVARGFPADRVEVIPNGIDTGRFAPDRQSGAALRRDWLGQGTGPLIGMVARVDPMKDHATFLRAARQFLAGRPGARFVCVGSQSTSYWPATRALCESLGIADRVRWEPTRNDIARVMNALDFLTLSSAFGEGFPNVVGEAMSCGIPTVVTDVGDAARLVGDCGVIVGTGDPAQLARGWAALADLPEDRRVELGQAARQRIVQNFSQDLLIERTAGRYAELVAGA